MDSDIFFVNYMKRAYIGNIKQFLNLKFAESKNKKKLQRENGFHLLNRFAFMHLLFMLLHKISCSEHYAQTKMSAHKLAVVFAAELQSKRYQFDIRTDLLKANAQSNRLDKKYEANFVRMIKILIYFASDIFPSFEEINWKVRHLVLCQGDEV